MRGPSAPAAFSSLTARERYLSDAGPANLQLAYHGHVPRARVDRLKDIDEEQRCWRTGQRHPFRLILELLSWYPALPATDMTKPKDIPAVIQFLNVDLDIYSSSNLQ